MTNPPSPAVVPATLGRRAGAFLIDAAIAVGIQGVLLGAVIGVIFARAQEWTEGSFTAMVLLSYLGIAAAGLAWTLVYTGMQGGRGSIGQRALGLQLRDAASGGRIGFWRALLRNVVWGLAGSVVVGYFSPLFDSSPRRQGWHDQVARAVVIDRKATEAAAAVPAPVPPAPTANPYLPPPAGAAADRFASSVVPVEGGFVPASVGAAAAPVSSGFAPASFAAPMPQSVAPGRPVPPAAAHVAPTGMIAHVPGITSGRDVAPPAPPAPPAPVASADELDETRTAASLAVRGDDRALAVLAWDDGTRVAVYGRTLFGRNPAPEADATVVAVRDETLSLSKTHFEIGGDAAGAWVADRHSTNGTALIRGGESRTLAPLQRTPLQPGDRLEFGDRSVTVGMGA